MGEEKGRPRGKVKNTGTACEASCLCLSDASVACFSTWCWRTSNVSFHFEQHVVFCCCCCSFVVEFALFFCGGDSDSAKVVVQQKTNLSKLLALCGCLRLEVRLQLLESPLPRAHAQKAYHIRHSK